MLFLQVFLVLACTSPKEERPGPEVCEAGFIADGYDCVPESCGAGRWGNLSVDGNTIYVDGSEPDGGDGTEAAPYATIQRGLNRAGALGGALVAVAAGSYPETLSFTTEHADVHLAGRCREMVILDASVGDGETPGIAIDTGYAAVEVTGVTVRDSSHAGLWVDSGEVRVRDVAVSGSMSSGVVVNHPAIEGMTDLVMETCVIDGNTRYGLFAYDSAATVTIRDTTVKGTRSDVNGEFGRGVNAQEGATLSTEGCLIDGNSETGLLASSPGTMVAMRDTMVKNTRPNTNGGLGRGIEVSDGATLSAVGCLVDGNTDLGLMATNPGTWVALTDMTVSDTHPDAHGERGRGIEVDDGAVLTATDCNIEGNSEMGLLAYDPGTEVTIHQTTVRDTRSNADGSGGGGIEVVDGATLYTRDCLVESNREQGIFGANPGTRLILRHTIVSDTRPNGNAAWGRGIGVVNGATLLAEGCLVEGNTEIGLFAQEPGTQAILTDTTVRNTKAETLEGYGLGIAVIEGASLLAEDCFFDGNSGDGVVATESGSQVVLRDTTVRDTRPDLYGRTGRGIEVNRGAALAAEHCLIEGNSDAGVLASHTGTHVVLRDSMILRTKAAFDSMASAAAGVTAEVGASISASRIIVHSTEGPGILVNTHGSMECVECTVQESQFAGAVALSGGTLQISDSIIEGTTANTNLLGGAGVYAWPWDGDPPTVILTNTLIQDNPVAGVWLIGNGNYVLGGNTIHGGIGEVFGSGFRCGDAILARDGVTAWDGKAGLLLQDNTFRDAEGAGIFLDDSSALMSGNTYTDNALDLVVQNQSCGSIPDSYSEAPRRDLCPTYSYPTCYAEFFYVAVPADPVDW